MKSNVVLAAAILALGFVGGCVILLLGINAAVDRAAGRFDATVSAHGQQIERAGVAVGQPIRDGLASLPETLAKVAASIDHAGSAIAKPDVSLKGILDLSQPVRVQGPREDGSLPVEAKLAK